MLARQLLREIYFSFPPTAIHLLDLRRGMGLWAEIYFIPNFPHSSARERVQVVPLLVAESPRFNGRQCPQSNFS